MDMSLNDIANVIIIIIIIIKLIINVIIVIAVDRDLTTSIIGR